MTDFSDFGSTAPQQPPSAPGGHFADFTQPKPKGGKVGAALAGAGRTIAGTAGVAAEQVLQPYWEAFKDASNRYIEGIKGAAKEKPDERGPVADVADAGRTLLAAVTGLGDFLDVLDPATKPALQKLADVVKPHLPEYTPAEKRGMHEGVMPSNWKMHQEEVQDAVEEVNNAIKNVVGFTAGAKVKPGEIPKAELTPREAARVEAGVPSPTTPEETPGFAGHPQDPKFQAPTEAGPATKAETIKPKLRLVGETPEGKPRVRLVSPEQARAEVSTAVTGKASEQAVVPRSESINATLSLDWLAPAHAMDPVFRQAYVTEQPLSAHGVLDQMIGAASTGRGADKYVRALLEKLREHIDDVPIRFADEIYKGDGSPAEPDTMGLYRYKTHDVQVRYRKGQVLDQTWDVVHEMIHAATSRFIEWNSNHPLVQELEALRKVAAARWESSIGGNLHYGLTNVHEFVAEGLINPRLQTALIKLEPPVKERASMVRTAWDKFSHIIRRMLGITDSRETHLLNGLLSRSARVMEEQAANARRMRSGAVTYEGGTSFDDTFAVLDRASIRERAEETAKETAGAIEQLIKMVNPEALGRQAKITAAVLANRLAERQWRTNGFERGSKPATGFWSANSHLMKDFLLKAETSEGFHDNPELARLKQRYKVWSNNLYQRDTLDFGIKKYAPKDNPIPHLFKEEEAVREYLIEKYPQHWSDPLFIRNRTLRTAQELIDAGFTPRFKTPEDMFLARQLSSDFSQMQVSLFRDLERYGTAVRGKSGQRAPAGYERKQAPDKAVYFVNSEVASVLHNAFDSYSLWQDEGLTGKGFRFGMAVKNVIIPLHLALSGFHALHVFGIDQAAGLARGLRSMLTNTRHATTALDDLLRSPDPTNIIANPRLGSRLVRAFDDAEAVQDLTDSEKLAVQYMLEGGFTPHMDAAYRNAGEKTLKEAWKGVATHPWKLPVALNTTLRRPIFEVWIPNLKAANYVKEVRQAMAADPTLAVDDVKRRMAFRRIQKSIDNRYGEMSYDTLMWTRWVKDVMVLNTLSLGWQMGFIREYGGGAMDLGQFAHKAYKGGREGAMQALKEGQLDRPLFVTAYTTLALGYTGLQSYLLSGQWPTGIDWVYPRTGETNPDGSPQRVNTMWYTREFASIFKHMESQGIVEGLYHLVASKSSGFLGLLTEFFGGVLGTRPIDSFGREFTNPDSPAYKRVAETLAHVLGEMEPISIQAIQREGLSPKSAALSIAGFTPAPKYATQTAIQNRIEADYHKFAAPEETSYGTALRSADYAKFRQQYAANGDTTEALQNLVDKYGLSHTQVNQLTRHAATGTTMDQYMFSQLPGDKQQGLMDRMSPEELEEYRPHAHKRLRQYEPEE